jgi:glycosyltransferase involved in cell wall biosynthesis
MMHYNSGDGRYLVSVCMITYNHENYIQQAVDGVLMQRTDFNFELIIGEDCSTDKTREIVLKYGAQYPDKIKLILQKENVGMMRNFIDTLNLCSGKYIALCEGDDYWTDPDKLQKQIDFLRTNPSFSICFHNVKVLYENSPELNRPASTHQQEVTTIENLAAKNYIHTASAVFKKCFLHLPTWFCECPIGDYPLHLINAQYGSIKFINEIMGVYRIHSNNAWGIKSSPYKTEKWMECLEILKDKFNENVNKNLETQLYYCCYQLAIYYYRKGDINRTFKKCKNYILKRGDSYFFFKANLFYYKTVDYLLPEGSLRKSFIKKLLKLTDFSSSR